MVINVKTEHHFVYAKAAWLGNSWIPNIQMVKTNATGVSNVTWYKRSLYRGAHCDRNIIRMSWDIISLVEYENI